MDMYSRDQYLQVLISQRGYLLESKKGKTELLDEYCRNTKQNRKYVIRKIRSGKYLKDKAKKRRRKEYYDSYVKVALIKCWEIFDYPCGQRLQPLLETEVDRLRKLGELQCSDEVAKKLKKMSFRTIDEKLTRQKEVECLKRKYHQKSHPLLYQKIPVKLFHEWDKNQIGNIQMDLIEHCGQSARGEYINTISATDIASGWWEAQAIMGRSQRATFNGINEVRSRFPLPWREIHTDNGAEFISSHLFRYAQQENFGFSRSRPNKKNDNCFIEQKNWTHVKKFVGYLRYDTEEELEILNYLYKEELRLYKNFFQPVMKLISKERIGGKIKRVYDTPKTPYQRVMESREVDEETKQELKKFYELLNPAELKRKIDNRLNTLYECYQKKNKSQDVKFQKKLKPNSVTFLIAQPEKFRLHN